MAILQLPEKDYEILKNNSYNFSQFWLTKCFNFEAFLLLKYMKNHNFVS